VYKNTLPKERSEAQCIIVHKKHFKFSLSQIALLLAAFGGCLGILIFMSGEFFRLSHALAAAVSKVLVSRPPALFCVSLSQKSPKEHRTCGLFSPEFFSILQELRVVPNSKGAVLKICERIRATARPSSAEARAKTLK
jgi:hypothetical protein